MTTLCRKSMKTVIAAMVAVAALTLASGCRRSVDPSAEQTSAVEQGRAALDEGDWSRAYDAFSKAIEANAEDVDAFYGRAVASLARAKEHYSLAQANATNGKIEEGQSEADKADGFFQKAADDADALLKIDPSYADAWFLKGVACQYQGMWEEGIDAFTECLKSAPDNAEAYQRRGEIYDHTGDYMNASVDFKKASELGFADDSVVATTPSVAAGDDDDFSDLKYDLEDNADSDE